MIAQPILGFSISSRVPMVAVALALALVGALGAIGDARQPNAQESLTEAQPVPTRADRSAWKLKDAESAISRAADWLGPLPETDRAPQAKLVILEDDDIPYLRDQLIDRPLWHVVVTGWRNDDKHEEHEIKDEYTRTLDVYLDPLTGGLLRIRSRWPEGEPPMPPTVSSAVATDQLQRSGREIYHGFVIEPPRVTFREALESGLSDADNAPPRRVAVQLRM